MIQNLSSEGDASHPENNDAVVSSQVGNVRSVPIKLPKAFPWITYSLLGITTIVFLSQLVTESLLGYDLPLAFGVKANNLIAAGQFWRLITPVFLHGSLLHIGFNMYALYIFGPALETYFGKTRFVILYFIGGFAGNVLSLVFSLSPSLGSSTAIFGLLGAQGVFFYKNQRIFGKYGKQALKQIVVIAAINLFIGLSPGIDNWGHVGGLIGGTLFAWFAGPVFYLEPGMDGLVLKDKREDRVVLLAGVGVTLLFVFIVAVTLSLR